MDILNMDILYTYKRGISPVIGVILMVAVTLALVSLVSVVVFDIGSDTSENPDSSLKVEKQGDTVVVNVLRNENVESIKVSGPSGNQKTISNPNAGSSVSISDGIGNYNIIGVMSDGSEQVIRTTELDLNLKTSTTSGTLSINPKIPNADIVSKDQNRRIIDRDETDGDGDFTVETVSEGSVMANVEGFDQYGTMTNINNDLYTSKEVKVSSVKSNSGIEFTENGADIVTLTNSSGDKVDVLFESKNGANQIGNPWQLQASNNDQIKNRNLELINSIDADRESFNSFNDGNAISSHPDVIKNGNKIKDKSKLSELSVTWINVGQADSILIQSKNGDNMLIDTGGFRDNGETVLNYLNKRGVNKIDHLVASHQDSDHIGGHEAVIRSFGSEGIGEIYDNGLVRTTETEDEYLTAVSDNGLSITEVKKGDEIAFDGAKVKVLNPQSSGDSGGSGSDNDMVVLRITHGNNAMFFGGDVESDTGSESTIINANQELDVEVMDVPHHGSSTSSSVTLLDALTPEVAVVSAPYDSQYGHPDDEVINRYENRNVDLFWTAANGNVTVTSDGTSITTSAEKGDVNDVTKDPNYEISVQSTDSSVEQGSTANVQVDVTNNGNVPDIQDIEMDVPGQNNPVDQKDNVKLTESESTSISLSWDTTGSEAKDYTVTVSSEDDTISRDISVTGGTGGSNNPTSDTLQSPSFESTGGWDFSDTDVQRSGSSDPSFDGDFSASMKDLTTSYGGRILESDPISVTGGEYYNAEIYYNIQASNGGRDSKLDEYSVEIVWPDGSDSPPSDGVFGDFSNTGGSWKEVSFSGQAPSNAESAKLKIRAKEGASNDPTVYWDSASLNEFSNQLSNPSFESTGSWDFTSTKVQRSGSSDPSFDGDFSASMKDLTSSGYDGRKLESDPISVTGGDMYQIGAYYNIQSPNGDRDGSTDEYSIDVVWLDNSGEIDTETNFGDFPSSTGSWKEASFSEQAPSNAESAKLRIRAKEGGSNDPTVYWDSAFISG